MHRELFQIRTKRKKTHATCTWWKHISNHSKCMQSYSKNLLTIFFALVRSFVRSWGSETGSCAHNVYRFSSFLHIRVDNRHWESSSTNRYFESNCLFVRKTRMRNSIQIYTDDQCIQTINAFEFRIHFSCEKEKGEWVTWVCLCIVQYVRSAITIWKWWWLKVV